MTTFSFSLIITPPYLKNEEDVANRLYESGCDDALFSVSNGVYSLDFDRESTSLKQAVDSATYDVENSGIGSSVIRSIYEPLAFLEAVNS